jgi:hypothetical protein
VVVWFAGAVSTVGHRVKIYLGLEKAPDPTGPPSVGAAVYRGLIAAALWFAGTYVLPGWDDSSVAGRIAGAVFFGAVIGALPFVKRRIQADPED